VSGSDVPGRPARPVTPGAAGHGDETASAMAVVPRAAGGRRGPADPPGAPGGKAGSPTSAAGAWQQVGRAFLANKLALVGLGIVVFMVLLCFAGPLVYHTNQTNAQLALTSNVPTNAAPSAAHLLGTDNGSFDELGRIMYAGQADLEVALAAAVLATVAGIIWGAVAGFAGGVLDTVMMRVVDAVLAVPALLLLIVISDLYKPSKLFLIVLIGLVAWLVPARLVRAETLSLRTREYVQAVQMFGGSNWRVVFRHIIPNALSTIVVNTTFQVADAILFLAALGYLGLGIQPPGTDWGTMLSTAVSDGAVVNNYWWLIWPPGLAIVLVAASFNLAGDALRDGLDVRFQQR
jgi:peptide/nickel transport system permease protein